MGRWCDIGGERGIKKRGREVKDRKEATNEKSE